MLLGGVREEEPSYRCFLPALNYHPEVLPSPSPLQKPLAVHGMPQEDLAWERTASCEGGDPTLSSENSVSGLGMGLGSGSAFNLSPGRGLGEQGDPVSNLTLCLQIKAAIGQRSEMCPSASGISDIEGICTPRLGRGMP